MNQILATRIVPPAQLALIALVALLATAALVAPRNETAPDFRLAAADLQRATLAGHPAARA